MPDAKLEIKVGAVSFTGEGAENWLSQQLDKVLKKLPELMQVGGDEPQDADAGKHDGANVPAPRRKQAPKTTLSAFIKDKKATGNQARKFLATAAWLHDHENKTRIKTSDVTNALNSHNQGKLSNAAQCLANNAKAGRVVRDGKQQFYVSDEGRAELDK